jgi:hypothetical protein
VKKKKIEEGELVMVYLRKKIFPIGMYSKIKYKKIGPCIILRKIYDNAYKLELLKDFDISLIFNVSELYEFHEGDENDDEDTMAEWNKQLPIKPTEYLEQVLANTICKKTQKKEYFEYLFKWRNRGYEYAL